MNDFNEFGLSPLLIESLAKMKIVTPTPVQIETIPPALAGHDILASAQTGSGKTVAYSIPLITKLMHEPEKGALILTPTRELAAQVNTTLKAVVGKAFPLTTALLIGGDSMFKQIAQLRKHPRLIVGTPGRIFDHLTRKSLRLDKTSFLIIDEADRMLDMGFGIQLEKIADFLPEVRQTLMFSATLPHNIEKLTKKYLREPKRITIGIGAQPPSQIKQEMIQTSQGEKFVKLSEELKKRDGSIIVFARTKRSVDKLTKALAIDEHSVDGIHGDLPQRRRENVISKFRHGKTRILIATDIAARGLDIPHIMHVINFDLPECPEDYIHRIGRTARAGAQGSALCFVSPDENYKWKNILKLMDPSLKDSEKPSGRAPQPKKGRSRGFKKPFDRKAKSSFFGDAPQKKRRSFQGEEGSAPRRQERSFPRQEGSFEKKRPFQKQEGSFERKRSFQERSSSRGQERPFERREEGSFERKRPFQRKEEESAPRRQERSFHKQEGSFEKKRPFQKQEGSFERKRPFQRKEEGSFEGRRPFSKERSFSRREEGSFSKPFQKQEGSFQNRQEGSFAKKKPFNLGEPPFRTKNFGKRPFNKGKKPLVKQGHEKRGNQKEHD